MYHQAWPWAGTASASPTSAYVQPAASAQVAAAQWPGYSQFAVSPEIQQQWAAAWASQAQYAYGTNVPVGETQATAFAGAYPDYQNATGTVVTTSETKPSDESNSASDQPKSSTEQPSSQDLAESEKIKQLKEQAEKWTSLQQPATASWTSTGNTSSSVENTTTVTASNDSSKSTTSTNVTYSTAAQSQMSKEEEEFERQFKDWEKQFETWKQQNQNHPDKKAFAQYEKQWQEWRAQLLQKKEQMQKMKAEQSSTAATAAGIVSTQTNSTSVTDTTAATTAAAMYYQHPQYMYMQQYMYPGATAVAPVAIPPVAGGPAPVVPGMVAAPGGVPAPSMQPGAMSQQMPYGMPGAPNSYGNQPLGPENMNYDNQRPQDFENDRNMFNYGPEGYEGYDNPNMAEGEYGREDWKFGRGRGRGRGARSRARGRGSRWGDPTEMDVRPGAGKAARKTLIPGGPAGFPEEDGPPPFEYPPEDCRDTFKEDSFPGGNPDDGFGFQDGPQQYPPEEGFPPQPFNEEFPPDPNQYPPDQEFPDRFHPDHEGFPPGREGFPPGREGFPPGREGFPPGREGFPPGRGRFPPKHERFPPGDRFHDQERFPPGRGRFPPKGGRFPPGDDGFPPEDGRFPPRHMMDDGGFRDFDQYPPEDEMYGPPPYRDDFPPFDDRGPRGRGRFSGRGRRFRGDFDRFGPSFPPRRRNDSFGGPQDFPPQPDDGFGFDDGPRMPPQRGMRPPFEPPFGPEERFPDEPGFFGDGPQRFKSIDYTHRPASAVMGDDYDPHYDYESEFQDDVNAYRARPPKRKKRDAQRKSGLEKKIASETNMEDKADTDMERDNYKPDAEKDMGNDKAEAIEKPNDNENNE